jgi:hypothetical protein
MEKLSLERLALAKAMACELVARCLLTSVASRAPDPQAFLRLTAEMATAALQGSVAGGLDPDVVRVVELAIEEVFVNAQKATFEDFATRMARDFPISRA